MKRLIIAATAAALISSAAFAQQPQERTYTVTLPESMWNAAAKHIARAPWEDVNPVITEIGKQIQGQIQQQAAAAAKQAKDEYEKRLQDELAKLKQAAPPEPETPQ